MAKNNGPKNAQSSTGSWQKRGGYTAGSKPASSLKPPPAKKK